MPSRHRGETEIQLEGASRRWVVSATSRRITSGKETQYPSYRRMGGPRGRSGWAQKIAHRGSNAGPSSQQQVAKPTTQSRSQIYMIGNNNDNCYLRDLQRVHKHNNNPYCPPSNIILRVQLHDMVTCFALTVIIKP